MDLNDFHFTLGQTLMYCQTIEHDIKLMLAGMSKGDFQKNLSKTENLTLGDALKKLEALDYSDDKPFISKNDYKFLNEIKEERNLLAHKIYNEFVYIDNFYNSQAYKTQCDKLLKFNKKLANVYRLVEKSRIDCLKQYGIID